MILCGLNIELVEDWEFFIKRKRDNKKREWRNKKEKGNNKNIRWNAGNDNAQVVQGFGFDALGILATSLFCSTSSHSTEASRAFSIVFIYVWYLLTIRDTLLFSSINSVFSFFNSFFFLSSINPHSHENLGAVSKVMKSTNTEISSLKLWLAVGDISFSLKWQFGYLGIWTHLQLYSQVF